MRLSALRPRRVPASATRRGVRSGRAAASGRSDAGLSLVEAIIAIAIVAVAVAATAAALSAASKSRDAAKERSLAAEIANEVLAKAETVGCGLLPKFDGVSAADRLKRCQSLHGDNTDISLGDMDWTETRDGRDFEVQIRLRWFAPGIDDEWFIDPDNATEADRFRQNYNTNQHFCRKRAEWASGLVTPTDNTTQDKQYARQPTILARTITVTPVGASQRATEITSHATVSPPADDSASINTNGIMIGPLTAGTNKEKSVILQDAQSSPTWTYMLAPDVNTDSSRLSHQEQYCAWFPFLERKTYYVSRQGVAGNPTDVNLGSTNCPKSTSPTDPSEICYFFSRK